MTLRVGFLLEGNSTGATRSITSVREAMGQLVRTTSETATALRKADIDAYGKQLDALRARYNPLFSTIQRYKAEVVSIRDAHRIGAISADEMTAAISRERQAALASIDTIKQRNKAMSETGGAARFNTANIAAQFQDIAVTSGMGMNPLQIALQQGTQLSAVFNEARASGQKLGVTLLGAFTSLIGPVSLITIGLTAAAAVGLQWLGGMLPKLETVNQWLDRQAAEIRQITDGYKGATGAVDDYIENVSRLPREVVALELGEKLKELRTAEKQFMNNAGTLGPILAVSGNAVEQQIGQLLVGFKEGRVSSTELLVELTKIKNTDLGLLGFAIKNLAGDLTDAARKASSFRDAYVSIEHAIASTAVNGGLQMALDGKIEGDRSAKQHQIELDAIRAKGPAQQADIARRRAALELANEEMSESLRRQKVEEAGQVAYAQAAQSLADSERSRLLTLKDSVEASRQQLTLLGKGVEETERLTFVRQNLAAAEAEASRNGTAVTAAYRQEVERLGTAYGELKQKIAVQQLADALQFDRSQLGRDPVEQTVASTLRPIFGNDQQSAQAQFLAGQIRINERLKEFSNTGRELTKGFLADLKAGLRDGVGGWDALAAAGANALDSIASKALDMVANGIFDLILGAFSGAIGGGGGAGFGRVGSFSIGNIPMYASGTGNHPGGLAMINERGRGEIVNLPGGTKVIPHDVSMEMARSSGAASLTLVYSPSISGAGMTEQQLKAMLAADRRALAEEFPAMYADAQRRAKI